MSEPAPSPAPTPALKQVIARVNWERVSIYAGGIAVILAIWICVLLYEIRVHPERFVRRALAQLPFSSSTGRVFWQNRRTLEIDDVKLGGFFYADAFIVTASPVGLLRRHVAKIEVKGGQLYTKPLTVMMDRLSGNNPNAGGLDWTIGRLEISRGTLLLQEMAPDMPAIPVRLGVSRPIILNNLKLNKPDLSPEMVMERTMDIENVNIVSPFDPLAPVLSFPLIRLRFTYNEFWHHHIREIDLVHPVMYLGQDLFWFSDEFKKQHGEPTPQGVGAPWVVAHFEAQYGQLAISAFGQPTVRLPFFVATSVDNIRLDQLDKISAKSTVAIQRLDHDYPDYKIRIDNLHGKLEFSLPLSDEKANNVVPTVFIDELSWNQIPTREVWAYATFDAEGMYGSLGGKCEGGYLKGNFEVYYTKGFVWNVDLSGDEINSQPIAERLVGKYINLTGALDGKIEIKGKATEILSCQGTLKLPSHGQLEIKSLPALMDRLPADASQMKRDLLKIAIASFQTYPYVNGEVKIDYKPASGVGSFRLDSPLGKRQLEMYWHPLESSKVAKDANNQ